MQLDEAAEESFEAMWATIGKINATLDVIAAKRARAANHGTCTDSPAPLATVIPLRARGCEP